MSRDELLNYYRRNTWSEHVNMFSVMLLFRSGEQRGSKSLRNELLGKNSPMLNALRAGVDASELPEDFFRQKTYLLNRQMMYYVIRAKEAGYLEHVAGTFTVATKYSITAAGLAYLEAGIQARINYLTAHPRQSFAQACAALEQKKINDRGHYATTARKRAEEGIYTEYVPNPGGMWLQTIWGIWPAQIEALPRVCHYILAVDVGNQHQKAQELALA